MKIAAVSEDETTISNHFGRAPFYVVVTVEDGVIVAREKRDKAGHHQVAHQHGAGDHHHHHGEHDHQHGAHRHGTGPAAHGRHARMVQPITDCEAVLARGMGDGAYQNLLARGITPIITDIAAIDEAVLAYAEGHIVNHIERLH